MNATSRSLAHPPGGMERASLRGRTAILFFLLSACAAGGGRPPDDAAGSGRSDASADAGADARPDEADGSRADVEARPDGAPEDGATSDASATSDGDRPDGAPSDGGGSDATVDGGDDAGLGECTPNALRCVGAIAQRCNVAGSTWLFDRVCSDGCELGLCARRCVAGAAQCRGDVREVCTDDGAGFRVASTCELGCDRDVCIEDALENHGVVTSLSGRHVYRGCVTIDFMGRIEVPAGETLEIEAQCLTIAASASIVLGAGASLSLFAREDIVNGGSITGGTSVQLSAYRSFSNTGTIRSNRAIVRGDVFANASGATIGADSFSAALYGESHTNDGTHAGTVSVMPPMRVGSPTHPAGGLYNLGGNDVAITWDRPFESAAGYYVTIGDIGLSLDRDPLRSVEIATFPREAFSPGENLVRVYTVNAAGVVGTYPEQIVLRFNVAPPVVTSSSHPIEGAYSERDDVLFEWSNPSELEGAGFTGFYWAWDRRADTIPGPGAGTFATRNTLLLADQLPGVHFFHLVNVDALGRTSPIAAHYEVRIGPAPTFGNVVGTVRDTATSRPIAGVELLLDGGLDFARSGATGDFTFGGDVPPGDYELVARAPGYGEYLASVRIEAGGTLVHAIELTASTASARYRLGWETRVASVAATAPSLAIGPRGRYIWSRNGAMVAEEEVAIVGPGGRAAMSETTLVEYYNWGPRTDVGWNGSEFYAVDTYKCGYDDWMNPGHGWSCLQMRTWDASGRVVAGWTRLRNSGQTGSPSAVWNGSSWQLFFWSYGTLYSRELDAELHFAGGGTGTTGHTMLASSFDDIRQSARTAAVWDGSGYAVVFLGVPPASDTNAIYFARWDAAMSATRSQIAVATGVIPNPEIGFAWDGSRYHVAYTHATRGVVLESFDAAGSVATDTTIAPAMPYQADVSLAGDGDTLLLAYCQGTPDVCALDVRRASDHGLVEHIDLGAVSKPRVSVSRTTGEARLLFVRGGATYVRALTLS